MRYLATREMTDFAKSRYTITHTVDNTKYNSRKLADNMTSIRTCLSCTCTAYILLMTDCEFQLTTENKM